MSISKDFNVLAELIENGDLEAAEAEIKRLLEGNHEAIVIMQDAIVPILRDIGDRFSRMELFLPSLILAGDVVKHIQPLLQEKLKTGESTSVGTVVIGSVYGDVHDIGKNIVVAMLEANGFVVYDIGVNVPSVDFVNRAKEHDADIVAMSSLMSTSIPYMKDVVELIRGNSALSERIKIMVGGGPVTFEIASEIGADEYGSDAAEAVLKAVALLATL